MMATNSSLCCQTSNPIICDFYHSNKKINFEKINLLVLEILKDSIELNPPLIESLSNEIPPDNSKDLKIILNKMFPFGNVQKINEKDILLKRMNKSVIYITNELDIENISEETTDNFIQRNKELKYNGILISQNSGIVDKNDFEIEIVNGNIFIFIHNMNYDIYKIKNAVNIIDILQEKLNMFNTQSSIFNIPNEILNEINQELQLFLIQKEEINEFIKDINKKIIKKMDNLKFTSLEKYLSSKLNTKKSGQHRCSICNNYTSNTLKGIAAHKRGCIKKANIY